MVDLCVEVHFVVDLDLGIDLRLGIELEVLVEVFVELLVAPTEEEGHEDQAGAEAKRREVEAEHGPMVALRRVEISRFARKRARATPRSGTARR